MAAQSYPRIKINAIGLYSAAIVLLLIPLPWLAAWLVSAMVHEAAHIAAVKICGGEILSLHIQGHGIIIETGPMTPMKSILCSGAGPAGGLFLLLLTNTFPRLAICGLLHSAYNLLPIYPLDGGRMLRTVLSRVFCIEKVRRVEIVVLITVIGFCIWSAVRFSLGILPVVLAVGLFVQSRKTNAPCND